MLLMFASSCFVCFFVLKFQFSWSCYHITFQLNICGKKSLHTFEQINISGAVWFCWFSSSVSHLKFSIHKKTIARYLVWISTGKSPGGDADLIFFNFFWLQLQERNKLWPVEARFHNCKKPQNSQAALSYYFKI